MERRRWTQLGETFMWRAACLTVKNAESSAALGCWGSMPSPVSAARLRVRHRAGVGEQHLLVPSVKLLRVSVSAEGDDEPDPQVRALPHPVCQAVGQVLGEFPGRLAPAQEL